MHPNQTVKRSNTVSEHEATRSESTLRQFVRKLGPALERIFTLPDFSGGFALATANGAPICPIPNENDSNRIKKPQIIFRDGDISEGTTGRWPYTEIEVNGQTLTSFTLGHHAGKIISGGCSEETARFIGQMIANFCANCTPSEAEEVRNILEGYACGHFVP